MRRYRALHRDVPVDDLVRPGKSKRFTSSDCAIAVSYEINVSRVLRIKVGQEIQQAISRGLGIGFTVIQRPPGVIRYSRPAEQAEAPLVTLPIEPFERGLGPAIFFPRRQIVVMD